MTGSDLIRAIGGVIAFAIIACLATCMPAHAQSCYQQSGTKCPALVLQRTGTGAPQRGNLPTGATLETRAPTSSSANIDFPPGPTPTSPPNGFCWMDDGTHALLAGFYCEVGGAPQGPLGGTATGNAVTLVCTQLVSGGGLTQIDFTAASTPPCSFPSGISNFKIRIATGVFSVVGGVPADISIGVGTASGATCTNSGNFVLVTNSPSNGGDFSVEVNINNFLATNTTPTDEFIGIYSNYVSLAFGSSVGSAVAGQTGGMQQNGTGTAFNCIFAYSEHTASGDTFKPGGSFSIYAISN